jgi:TDG/mug DNA glycosylase family protein
MSRSKRHRPSALAFNGNKAAQTVLGRAVEYGPQPERIAGARVFDPSPFPLSMSGAARGFCDERYWRELGAACQPSGRQ